MPLVPAAIAAVIFGARPDETEVALRVHRAVERPGEARPAGAAVELVRTGEQGLVTGSADVGAFAILLVERTAAGRLGPLLEQDVEPVLGQNVLPSLATRALAVRGCRRRGLVTDCTNGQREHGQRQGCGQISQHGSSSHIVFA